MRLLQAGKAYAPHIGGVETVMRNVAEGAAAAGWDSAVLVAGDDRKGGRESRYGVDVIRTPSLGRALSLPLAPTYGRTLRRQQADTLLIHEPTLLAALGLVGHSKELRKRFDRVLVWWHSDIVRQRLASPAYRPVIRNLLDFADGIIVATPNHVTSSDTLPAYRDKISVIPYGVDLPRYASSPERTDRVAALRSGLAEGPLVVFAGRLARYKGISQLVRAMELVSDGHLVVAGRGPCEADVRDSAAFRAGRITLLPHLDDPEFVDLLWAADIFVLPSTQPSEAFGIAQVEAMLCATPVVTFDLPTGVTWVNRHRETGLVAPLDDVGALARAIDELVRDEPLRLQLGDAARRRAERTFGLDTSVAATLELCGATPLPRSPASL